MTEEASDWHRAHRLDGGGVRLAPGWQAGVVVTVRSDLGYHWGFSEGHVERSAAFQKSSDEPPELIRDHSCPGLASRH